MKHIAIGALTLAGVFVAMPSALAADLTLTIEGIERLEGKLMIALCDEDAYAGDGATKGALVPVDAETVTTVFADLEPGEYAVRLFHDINDDGEMGTNPFGIPTEPYAFSNNASGRFGPAKWADAKFTVGADDLTHTISMN